ncbi:FRG domain-containing protein [Streptomyces luteogriseus]|uniref:FRG domain-containing protein n=1 Tax=Streptomyces luteogriseus TaxID=68233 RepID=UPI0037BE12D9
MRSISRIGTLHVGRRYAWRGISDWSFRIRSSMLRYLLSETTVAPDTPLPTEETVRERELKILQRARQWGIGHENGVPGDLQLLALLQHHGAPTRLLDVTSNPMTALWFACQNADRKDVRGIPRDARGVLFAFDVTDYPAYDTVYSGRGTWGYTGDPEGWPLQQALELSSEELRPFILNPTFRDARMQAQEGFFISAAAVDGFSIPGIDGIPFPHAPTPGAAAFENLFAPDERKAGRPKALPFAALVIPTKIKQQMLKHLSGTYNRSYRTLFPDVNGFTTALRQGNVDLSN